jgi:hypothetical protein
MVKYTRKTKRITRRGVTCRGKKTTSRQRLNSRRQKKGG